MYGVLKEYTNKIKRFLRFVFWYHYFAKINVEIIQNIKRPELPCYLAVVSGSTGRNWNWHLKNDGAPKIIATLFSHELTYECDLTVHRQIDWQSKCASTHSAICLALEGGRPPIISNNLQDRKLSEVGHKANTTQYKSQAQHMIQLTTAK